MKYKETEEWVRKSMKRYPHTMAAEHNAPHYLYTSTSTYRKGNTPRSHKEYIGVVTTEGYIPKKEQPMIATGEMPQEFGLSYVLKVNVERPVQQSSSFNGGNIKDLIRLAIIQYVFGSCDPTCILASSISRGSEQELIQLGEKISASRLDRTVKKVERIYEGLIPDKKDRDMFSTMLKMITLPQWMPVPERPRFPEAIEKIAHNHSIRLYRGERI